MISSFSHCQKRSRHVQLKLKDIVSDTVHDKTYPTVSKISSGITSRPTRVLISLRVMSSLKALDKTSIGGLGFVASLTLSSIWWRIRQDKNVNPAISELDYGCLNPGKSLKKCSSRSRSWGKSQLTSSERGGKSLSSSSSSSASLSSSLDSTKTSSTGGLIRLVSVKVFWMRSTKSWRRHRDEKQSIDKVDKGTVRYSVVRRSTAWP